MDNGNGSSAETVVVVASPRPRPPVPRGKPRDRNLLYKMIGVAVVAHLVLILGTSRGLFVTDPESPEEVFKRAEDALAANHYLEAMDLYQQVLDKQPKLPPVFERAAEQHRAAEKLAKAQAAKLTATKPADPAAPSSPTTARADAAAPVKPAPASKPEFDVPPELRPK